MENAENNTQRVTVSVKFNDDELTEIKKAAFLVGENRHKFMHGTILKRARRLLKAITK